MLTLRPYQTECLEADSEIEEACEKHPGLNLDRVTDLEALGDFLKRKSPYWGDCFASLTMTKYRVIARSFSDEAISKRV